MSTTIVRAGRPSTRLRPLSAREFRQAAPPISATAVIASAIWCGLATGLLELGVTLWLEPHYDPTPGLFRGNRHMLWMIPVANLSLFAGAGLLLGTLKKLGVKAAAQIAPFTFTFLSLLTLLLTIRGMFPIACAALAAGVAFRLAPWLRRLAQRAVVRKLAAITLIAMSAGLIAIVALTYGRAWSSERAALANLKPPAAAAPNVLLIVLDTVRADHLSPYGYERDTTPNLARLAQRGVTFDRARATASWTLPSHASMMTGRWPHELSASILGPLDDKHATIAETMQSAGYSTSGFVANTLYCSDEAGLARGFIHYEDHILSPRTILLGSALGKRILDKWVSSLCSFADRMGIGGGALASNGKPYKDAAEINREFLSWQEAQAKQARPFFAFLNYFDAHDPYLVPPGYDRHFGLRPTTHADEVLLARWWGVAKRKLSDRDVDLARDAYDDCIGYLDEQLGVLFETLEKRGVLKNTVVIVTADHGEHFGEHDLFGHASSLYQPEIHVPLIVVSPREVPQGTRVPDTVSLRDIPATVSDLAGISESHSFPGGSLKRFWSATRSAPLPHDRALSEVDNPAKVKHANNGRSPVFRGPMKALAVGDAVYIRNGDGREELYDLATDPGEEQNLAGQPASAELLQQMRADLESTSPNSANRASKRRK